MTEKLRIAMIGGRGLPNVDGGVERAVLALSRELAALGQEVTVYGRRPYCAPDTRTFDGVSQVPLPCIPTKHLEAVSHSAIATVHASLPDRYDVIHFHAIGPAALSFVPRLAGRASVATIHALDYQREKWGRIATTALRGAAAAASRIPNETIAVSQELASHISTAYGRNAYYIPNGVDLPKLSSEQPVPELVGKDFVLYLGRLVPEKGIHTLIHAFRELDTRASLAIVGEASYTSDYVTELRDLASSDTRITFLGSRRDGQKLWLLRHSAVFAQPSTLEGLPIGLLEACACGTPVVISDIAANLEASAHSPVPPIVFAPGDQGALRDALAAALGRQSNPRNRGAPVIPAEHGWPQIAERTLAVYLQAAHASTTRHHCRPASKQPQRPWISQ